MFNYWLYDNLERQHRKEVEEQAERYRMLLAARQAEGYPVHFHQRLMNRLGVLLVDWGSRLQARATLDWKNMESAEFEHEPYTGW